MQVNMIEYIVPSCVLLCAFGRHFVAPHSRPKMAANVSAIPKKITPENAKIAISPSGNPPPNKIQVRLVGIPRPIRRYKWVSNIRFPDFSL